jgi:ATP-binding cassette subfamily B protein
MKDGNIISEGTHSELLDKSEEYKKLWEASLSASTWKIKGEA